MRIALQLPRTIVPRAAAVHIANTYNDHCTQAHRAAVLKLTASSSNAIEKERLFGAAAMPQLGKLEVSGRGSHSALSGSAW